MATSSNPTQFSSLIDRAYKLSNADEAKDLYNEWAERYDNDVASEEYLSPQSTVDAVIRELPSDRTGEIKILDAGCGTGLVGECFKKSKIADSSVVDGTDLVQAMLDVARQKNVYRDLEVADLTQAIARPDGSYDVVTCVGTLTKGHVGPAVLKEFARVTAKGGIVVATVHNDIWESMKYKSTVNELRDANVVEIVSTDDFHMYKGLNDTGRMVVLRKI